MTLTLNHLEITYPTSGKTLHYHQQWQLPTQGFALLSAESGKGKTTLLHAIAALLPPSSGEIQGVQPGTTAIMFQESRLFPWRKVTQHLTDVVPSKPDPLPYLAQVGLEAEGTLYPHSLSGGMARRLSLARTLYYGAHMGATLYLLDEPFAGVDEPRILTLLPLLAQLDAPVIVASHLPLLQDHATTLLTL